MRFRVIIETTTKLERPLQYFSNDKTDAVRWATKTAKSKCIRDGSIVVYEVCEHQVVRMPLE